MTIVQLRTGAAPATVEMMIRALGTHLADARKRRRWTQEQLAAKAGITRQTLAKMERGSLGTSLSAYAAVLWAMGLHHPLMTLAAPEQDREGQVLEKARRGKRMRSTDAADADF